MPLVIRAEHILADLSPVRALAEYHARKTKGPPQPCSNAHRGCDGMTGGPRGGRGLCDRCFNRWERHGDSWYHVQPVHLCTNPRCFLGHRKDKADAPEVEQGSD